MNGRPAPVPDRDATASSSAGHQVSRAHRGARDGDADAVPRRRRPPEAPDVNPDRHSMTNTAASSPVTRARPRVVTLPRRPVHYSRLTQQWLDFLAGLLAQTAQAERASADRTESPARL